MSSSLTQALRRALGATNPPADSREPSYRHLNAARGTFKVSAIQDAVTGYRLVLELMGSAQIGIMKIGGSVEAVPAQGGGFEFQDVDFHYQVRRDHGRDTEPLVGAQKDALLDQVRAALPDWVQANADYIDFSANARRDAEIGRIQAEIDWANRVGQIVSAWKEEYVAENQAKIHGLMNPQPPADPVADDAVAAADGIPEVEVPPAP